MDGVHDMGGMQDFGPIRPEADEPVFHVPWEGRVVALNFALLAWGKWNLNVARAALMDVAKLNGLIVDKSETKTNFTPTVIELIAGP